MRPLPPSCPPSSQAPFLISSCFPHCPPSLLHCLTPPSGVLIPLPLTPWFPGPRSSCPVEPPALLSPSVACLAPSLPTPLSRSTRENREGSLKDLGPQMAPCRLSIPFSFEVSELLWNVERCRCTCTSIYLSLYLFFFFALNIPWKVKSTRADDFSCVLFTAVAPGPRTVLGYNVGAQ